MSALSAPAADIQMTSLPFNITAPGTYVLTGDLSFALGNGQAAIYVTTPVPGPVTIDLKGFTITGSGGGYSVSGILVGYYGAYNAYPVTVRNGMIKNFGNGVWIYIQTDVTVKNVAFYDDGYGVSLFQSSSSTIKLARLE
jgi:hypothetical protein